MLMLSFARMNTTKRWTIVAAVLGSGIVFLDSTLVSVALPAISAELPSRLFRVLEAQSFVYNGYLLTLSALLILAGALADYYGRRRLFLIGLAGFGFTSLLCGLAPTMDLLIVFRVLQGAAGALLVPGSLAIIASAFSGEEQGRAFGIWAGASGATTILGPFVGGVLVDSVSWRAAFLINVPLVIIAMYATRTCVVESRDQQSVGKFDWLGAAVIAVAVGGLSLGSIRGQEHGWSNPSAAWALLAGIVATIAFPFLMKRSAHPLVPLELFRSRNFTIANLSTLVIYGALYTGFYYIVIFTQGTLGYTAAAAGVAVIPGTLFLTFLSTRAGRLASRHGPRFFLVAGPALMGLGVLWFARLPALSAPWTLEATRPASLVPPFGYVTDLLPGLLVFGIGLVLMVAPLTATVMTSVPNHNSGVASAINNALSRVGPQLVGAVIFVAITAVFYGGIADRAPDVKVSSESFRKVVAPLNPAGPGVDLSLLPAIRQSSTDSLHLAMKICAGLLIAGAAINMGIRNPASAMEKTDTTKSGMI